MRARNADAAAIVEHEKLFPEVETPDEALAFVGGGDGTMALDHEIVFVSSLSQHILPTFQFQHRVHVHLMLHHHR